MAEPTPPDTAESDVPEVCIPCSFGSGPRRDCSLIQESRLPRLLEDGPCRLDEQLRRATVRIVRSRYPLSLPLADDIAQDGLLRLLERAEAFPGTRLKRLPETRRWLNRFVQNHVIDFLRKSRVITRLRCGACVHFSRTGQGRCTLEFLPDDGAGMMPNPWWGEKVHRKTDPRALEPPCGAFSWSRPGVYDIFENEVVSTPAQAHGRQRAASTVVLALDRLASSSDRGLREAATLRSHYLGGKTVAEIAAQSAVSEKTIKRLLASGREALLEHLRRDFAVESVAELME